MYHYSHSTAEKLKSRDVKPLTQGKELANNRAMIQTQREHSFCIRLCTCGNIYASFLSISVEWTNLFVYWVWYLMPTTSQCYHLFNLIYPKTLWASQTNCFILPRLILFPPDTCLLWLNLKGWHSSSLSIQYPPKSQVHISEPQIGNYSKLLLTLMSLSGGESWYIFSMPSSNRWYGKKWAAQSSAPEFNNLSSSTRPCDFGPVLKLQFPFL